MHTYISYICHTYLYIYDDIEIEVIEVWAVYIDIYKMSILYLKV